MYEMLDVKSQVRDYAVLFTDSFRDELAQDAGEKRCFFIVDRSVYRLYHQQLQDILPPERFLVVEAIEEHKSLDYVKTVIKSLLNSDIKRNDRVIALGGGIIQDIAGFVSSVLFRGIEWFFYPTTLLAQCDSCIGSKTSLNVDEFKNQLGTFYPPYHIVLDVNFLKTLSSADMRSGLGEIIKVHLLDGPDSLEYISSKYDESSAPNVLKELISRSLRIKKAIIEEDEFDRDYRNILNYGHTFGHAVESITDYKVSHGQAVTVGMDIENYLSFRLQILPQVSLHSMRTPIMKNYPDFQLKEEHMEQLLVALSKDKKNVDENLTVILTKGPGEMLKTKLPLKDGVKEYIKEYVDDYGQTIQ
jgi:3-dehydroquinate synthase